MVDHSPPGTGGPVPLHNPHGEARVGADRQRLVWTLWYPDASAQGLFFARGRMDAFDTVLVHAAPPRLTVEVQDDQGRLLARGRDLPCTADTPIARLTRHGGDIGRQDIWPDAGDIGRPVILPGGEVGILLDWWHAPDHEEWRWRVEFYNHR